MAAGCSGGGGGGGDSGGGSGGGGTNFEDPGTVGEDGGEPAPTVPDGTIVGMFETAGSNPTPLMLRGTLPIPKGTFPRANGIGVFTVLDADGTPLTTQTEIVSRYPRSIDGADVVEIMAHVTKPAGATGPQRYLIQQMPQPSSPPPGAPGLEDLAMGPEVIQASVLDLAADPTAIKISAYDCFDNEYACYPLDGTGTMKLMRYGPIQTELRVYQTMQPLAPDSGPTGTLPHLFGVHAYLSTFSGEDMLGFDLRFNNGHSGHDKSTPLDDPLDKIYFDRIEITIPSDWILQQSFDDPYFDGYVDQGNERVYSLVKPNPGGGLHMMPWQGQFHRRLMIAKPNAGGRSRGYLDGQGRAFCVPGTDPNQGTEYWSWWNRGTARYFPQSTQMPNLDHIGQSQLRADLNNEYNWLKGRLADGSSDGDYPIWSTRLGWAHPYGVSYGGMTSGAEIYCYDGIELANAPVYQGLRAFQATHRMHSDRQPTAFYNVDGEPTSVEDWAVIRQGAVDYVPFFHFHTPKLEPGDPFGFDQAPQFQINHVQSVGRQPAYESALLSFDPHDFQHYVRYTRSAKVLAWLSNDSIAKDDLRMAAETFRLSYHRYFNSPGGYPQGSGMRSAQIYVAKYPGTGFGFGRGEAWGTDAVVSAYAVAEPAWRNQVYPWFEDVAQLVFDGQASCSGFIQSIVAGKFVGGQYRARQAIEGAITENALQGLRETVFRGRDTALSNMVRDTLRKSVYSSISPMAWFPGEPAPWTYTANGPQDLDSAPWCSINQIPSNGVTRVYERYQNWSSFAHGYELAGDDQFLDKALIQGGGTELLQMMRAGGRSNLKNEAALIALAQHLAGLQ